MKFTNDITKATCYFLIIASCFIISCNKENDIAIQIPIEIYCQIPPTVTSMTESSIISMPDGVIEEHVVINSEEELHRNIPSQIINNNYEYQNLNFDDLSLIMIKLRLFFELKDIEYKIYRGNANTYLIKQSLSVKNNALSNGLFVMSCVVTEKIAVNNELIIEQSFQFL